MDSEISCLTIILIVRSNSAPDIKCFFYGWVPQRASPRALSHADCRNFSSPAAHPHITSPFPLRNCLPSFMSCFWGGLGHSGGWEKSLLREWKFLGFYFLLAVLCWVCEAWMLSLPVLVYLNVCIFGNWLECSRRKLSQMNWINRYKQQHYGWDPSAFMSESIILCADFGPFLLSASAAEKRERGAS